MLLLPHSSCKYGISELVLLESGAKNGSIIQVNICSQVVLFMDYIDILQLLAYIEWNIYFHTEASSAFADVCIKIN